MVRIWWHRRVERLFSPSQRGGHVAPRLRVCRRRPALEALEDRTLPSFVAVALFDTGAAPRSVVAADVNGDGIPDLVTANIGAETGSVLVGNGDGSFQAEQDYATGAAARSVAAADVNGDGIPALVTANTGSNTVSVLLGNGDGSFQAKKDFVTGYAPNSVAVADVNGDGIPDLVTANGTGG